MFKLFNFVIQSQEEFSTREKQAKNSWVTLTMARDSAISKLAILETELERVKKQPPSWMFENFDIRAQEKISNYLTKYPSALIRYNAQPNPVTKVNYPVDIRVFALCGQNDGDMLQFLKDKFATVGQVRKQFPKLTFHQACDEVMLRIHKATPVNYQLDYNIYGFLEFWQFAPLVHKIGRDDCDGWAVYRYVLSRLAGVPHFLMRVGVGMTFDNQGHATFYYLPSSLEGFLHLNSTTTFVNEQTVQEMAKRDSQLAIKDFWFSFDEKQAWSKFTPEAKDSFKEQNKLTVTPSLN